MAAYTTIIAESYHFLGGGSPESIRVRPLAGQEFSVDLNIECSRAVRYKHPVGTLFKLSVKLTNRDGGEFLYSSYQWPMSVVSEAEAEEFIRRAHG